MNHRHGLVMAEALVAISTLIVGTFVLSTIVSNAVSATSTSRDYLLAQNLITEAAEAVKNVRDSNWLIYPSRKECWLMLNPGSVPLAECGDAPDVSVPPPPAVSNYLATQSGDGWVLEDPVSPQSLDLETNTPTESDPYALHIQSIEDQHEYVSSTVINNNPSGFYRSIEFTALNDPDSDGIVDNAQFEVKVEWRDGAKVRSITRKFTIYNYL